MHEYVIKMHKYVLICNQDVKICHINYTILYTSQEYVNMHKYAMSFANQ